MNVEVYLQEIMRNVASSLMIPVMIVLVCLILFAVYSIGSLLAELVLERRHFKANMPRDIKAIKEASYDDLPKVIEETGLLRRQKQALQVLVANMGLPEDDLFALARAEVSQTDAWNRRKVARTDLVTKIAPMMGLMCTLIPLGPGIVAMGQGEVNLLSNSLLVAFDGTVAGLIGGVVSMVVSSVRKRWYANYLVAMESLTTCVLEKAQQARKDGVQLPCEGDIRVQADMSRAGIGRAPRPKRNDEAAVRDGAGASGRRRGAEGAEPATSAPAVQANALNMPATSPTLAAGMGAASQAFAGAAGASVQMPVAGQMPQGAAFSAGQAPVPGGGFAGQPFGGDAGAFGQAPAANLGAQGQAPAQYASSAGQMPAGFGEGGQR